MAQQIDLWKYLNLTQTVADTMVEASAATEIDPANGEAWLITQIDITYALSALMNNTGDFLYTYSVTRDTKTGVASYGDVDTIHTGGFARTFTTSGSDSISATEIYVPPAGTLFVEPEIFAQFNTVGTGAVQAAFMRIHYQLVRVTEVEILRLLNNR